MEAQNRDEFLEVLKAGLPEAPTAVDTQTLRYALYLRKSTTSEDTQASSIEDQLRDCMERLITPNRLNIVKVYKESFSAKVADLREQFNAMINEIENGRIDGVIAWHPDRLSRNMKEAGAIIDLVDRRLIKDLQFATFTFENTPAGKMLLGITFVMAKQYSEHLSESVERGNRRAVEDGEFIGKFKHGYIVDANRTFQPDPRNFTKVKHMFEMALAGKSQKDICSWINTQGYTVQKRPEGEYVAHVWDKDDVSKTLKDPHYVGIHKWGKTLVDLTKSYDFEPMISVADFMKINKVSSLKDAKIHSINRPKGGSIRANLLRGMVYCGACNTTLTSMIIDNKNKPSRYYYKCENEECRVHGLSARAGLVLEQAQSFFNSYLFVTKENYAEYARQAKLNVKRKSRELESTLAGMKTTIANKKRSYEQTKELILASPELKEHYDLNKYSKEIVQLEADYAKVTSAKNHAMDHIPSFEEYLKIMTTTPVILGKIHDMKDMDALLRTFFLKFTITPGEKGFRKGSEVSYILNEPWEGFVKSNEFVSGAGTGTLTLDLVLGKDAL